MSKSDLNSNTIGLIYAGGTFGSHGESLSPLSADVFLPLLEKRLQEFAWSVSIIDNPIIKDSSRLTSADFIGFYKLIIQAYQAGFRRLVLISGTDTLSFLAAFLSHALSSLDDISLVLTGSMQPLLAAKQLPYQINEQSDAWQNLEQALILSTKKTGVFLQFHQQAFFGHNTQKIHSHYAKAFDGQPCTTTSPFKSIFKTGYLADPDQLSQKAKQTSIKAIYCLPNDPMQLVQEFERLTQDTKAVILIGFGAGNIPCTSELIDILTKKQVQGLVVICTTMCAFGGVNDNYAAGAWQYQHGIWSSGTLSISAIYGQVLWLALTDHLYPNYWQIP